MFLLRPARLDDLPAILELAAFLDSPNLPRDETCLSDRLARSAHSFAQPGPPEVEREYQFALVDGSERVVGTCAILSKHGTPEMPHLFLRVSEEERHAASIDVKLRHLTFQLGKTHDGPSEIGALVLHPDARGREGWPGKLLSWGRFAYIGLNPGCFESHVLAEMRASFDDQGRNAFWDAFGRRFTGLSYAEADRRSAVDKSFILDLFPDSPFYVSLLDEHVAAELGRVHAETRPAVRLLEQAGLRWIGEIDPFDAGPFYGALTGDVIPISQTVRATVGKGGVPDSAPPAIAVACGTGEFRAVAARAHCADGCAFLPKEAKKRLRVGVGDEIAITPLPVSSRG